MWPPIYRPRAIRKQSDRGSGGPELSSDHILCSPFPKIASEHTFLSCPMGYTAPMTASVGPEMQGRGGQEAEKTDLGLGSICGSAM